MTITQVTGGLPVLQTLKLTQGTGVREMPVPEDGAADGDTVTLSREGINRLEAENAFFSDEARSLSARARATLESNEGLTLAKGSFAEAFA